MNLYASILLLSVAATRSNATLCGCDSCTQEVWDSPATNSDGSFTCGGRINWLQKNQDYDEAGACVKVSDEFIDGPCGPMCNPSKCKPPMCGCNSCTGDVLASIAEGHSCESRIGWVMENHGISETDACSLVADEYPSTCGVCHAGHCGSHPPGGSVKVMSYNTEYTGYWDGRFSSFADHISDVGADLVGLQECQDASGMASASEYTLLPASGNGNTILFKSNRLEVLRSGSFNIPSDEYAQRNISWGKFRITQGAGVGSKFLFFNTHLPHRHGEAADPNTHSIIAKMLLEKREELGAGPTIVTGDCNPFASSGASKGSFESNLAAGGIIKVYKATGSTGGYAGLDKIFASQEHWTWSNAADVGTGRSDHPGIAADLSL